MDRIKIIKHGSTYRKYKCPHCYCEFGTTEIGLKSITFVDRNWFYVRCPECENHMFLDFIPGLSESMKENCKLYIPDSIIILDKETKRKI